MVHSELSQPQALWAPERDWLGGDGEPYTSLCYRSVKGREGNNQKGKKK